MTQKDRYLVQFWDEDAGRFLTDCAFQDGKLIKAVVHAARIMQSKDAPLIGQILDQSKGVYIWQEINFEHRD